MADELLRLYAERQALPGEALPARRRRLPRLRGHVPVRRDRRPGARHRRREQGPRVDAADGPPRLRRRRLRQDRGRAARGVPRRPWPASRSRCSARRRCSRSSTSAPSRRAWPATRSRVRALSRFQTKKEQEETARRPQGRQGRRRHRHAPPALEGRPLQAPRPARRRRGAALRRHAQGAHQAARAQVDVLTLTATPIPRTLQMAVTGLRDLSLITTPPVDRRAVRTIVTRWDDQVVREAVQRELARGGQVFYVYNRIEGLYEKAQRLQELVPTGAHRGGARADERGGARGGDARLRRRALRRARARRRSSRAASTSRARTR